MNTIKTLLAIRPLLAVLFFVPYVVGANKIPLNESIMFDFDDKGRLFVYSKVDGEPEQKFSLKLKTIGKSEFTKPQSIQRNDKTIDIKWNQYVTETWSWEDSQLHQSITINEDPSGSSYGYLDFDFPNDLEVFCVGSTCNWSDTNYWVEPPQDRRKKTMTMSADAYALIDNSCRQIELKASGMEHYSFDTSDVHWPVRFEKTYQINNKSNDQNYHIISVDSKWMVVSNRYSKVIHVYENKQGVWKLFQKIELSQEIDYPGVVLLEDNQLFISASKKLSVDTPRSDCDSYNCLKEIVVHYQFKNHKWSLNSTIQSIEKESHHNAFGSNLAYHKGELYITNSGSRYKTNDSLQHSGVVHVYSYTDSSWTYKQSLKAKSKIESFDFGGYISVSDDTLLIPHNSIEEQTETIYFNLFRKTDDLWEIENQFIYDSYTDKNHGFIPYSVEITDSKKQIISGKGNLYGYRGQSSNSNHSQHSFQESGEVLISTQKRGNWKQKKIIESPYPVQWDGFGSQVKVHGDLMIVSAPGESSDGSGINSEIKNCRLSSSGALFVYKQTRRGWIFIQSIKSQNPQRLQWFGSLFDFDGDTLIVIDNGVNIYQWNDEKQSFEFKQNIQRKDL